MTTISSPTPYPIGDVNAYLVKGDTLTLIDAGTKTPEALAAIEYGIKGAGYALRDIEQVLVTHHHPDHIGWVDAFPNAELLGHAYNDVWLQADAAFLQSVVPFYEQQYVMQGVPTNLANELIGRRRTKKYETYRPLTQVLEDGDIIPGHPHLKAVFTPGHARSHFIFVNEKENCAFGGDLLLPTVASNPLIEPPLDKGEFRTKSMLQYNESLKRLQQYNVQTLYPGHGDIIQNPNVLIEERLARLHKQAMRLLTFVSDTPQSVFELTAKYYANIYLKQLALTLSKTMGVIDYLVDLGMVHESVSQQGVFVYTCSNK